MINSDKLKLMENAYQAGAEAEILEMVAWLEERVNKHQHLKLNEPCHSCLAWQQAIQHLSDRPARKPDTLRALMDETSAVATKDELARVIKIIEQTPFIWMGDTQAIQISRDKLIESLQLPVDECSCDPCSDRNCDCWGKRCSYCESQDG